MTDTVKQCREHAATALYPFLAIGADWDEDLVRRAAYEAIDCYAPKTPREVQLSAQIVACSFAAIACLRSAMTGRDLSIETILSLQETALDLDEQASRTVRMLEARQKERQRSPQAVTAQSVAWDLSSFNRTLNAALKIMREAELKAAASRPSPRPCTPKLHVMSAVPMTTSVLEQLAQSSRVPTRVKPRPRKQGAVQH